MFAAEPDLLQHLPVAGLPNRMWPELTRWTETLENGPDHVAAEAVTDAELAGLTAATLHIGGWHDLLADETLRQWHLTGSGVAGARPSRSLVVGPWDHDLGFAGTTTIGCQDYGSDSRIPLGQWQIEWLRDVLDPAGRRDEARVFVIGAGWSRGAGWPPPSTTRVWHARTDGTLGFGAGPADTTFRYDPADPYPSVDAGADRGPLIAARADAVRYSSVPLEVPATIAGTPVVRLAASSSAPAVDFVVRLCEITAGGRIIAVSQGAVDTGRAGPGPYAIALDAVAIRLPAGSRLLLEVTGGDFPLLARGLGGADRYRGTAMVPVEQHVHRAELHLPIVED